MEIFQKVNAITLFGCECKRREIGQGESRPADHDPLRSFEQLIRLPPAAKIQKRIGAGDDKKLYRTGPAALLLKGMPETTQRIDREVGLAVLARRVELRRHKLSRLRRRGFRRTQQLDHCKAVGKARVRSTRFEWLLGNGSEKDGVERKFSARCPRYGEVSAMGWVESAAEEGCAHGVFS